MKLRHLLLFTLGTLVLACSTAPTGPDWIRQNSRLVDNGYIVYTGTGEDPSLERAQFLAEGIALQDMANECSFAPKGARIEDRYNEKVKYQYHAYAKVGIELQECDEAKKAVEPENIRTLANQPFTEQVKKYQDIVDAEGPEEGGAVSAAPTTEAVAANTPPPVVHDNFSFFVVRQQMAYEKEVVILSPPTAYQPAAPETVAFKKTVMEPTNQIQTFEKNNPQIRAAPTTWSSLPNKPAVHTLKPQNLKAMSPVSRPHPLRPPPTPGRGGRNGEPGGGRKAPPGNGMRRHRRGYSEPGGYQ